jgi:Ran GTPase-activating protein (RanGAP) involved in mRNA processing and transport
VFRRGFVDEVKVEAKQFLRLAHELFTAAPVRHIHLLDVSESLPAALQCPYLSRLAGLTVHAQHTGEPLARAVARSEHLAGLRRLALTRNRFTDDAAEHLARSPHLANLEELDLSENEIGETGARALAAAPALAKLRRLEMRDNALGPAGAEALAGSERLTALHRLGLSGNEVGLPRLLTLGRAHDLLRVPVLDLSANGLTVAGLQAILTRPPVESAAVRVVDLDVSHNEGLGDDGARLLAACPHLAQLAALRLAHCGIGDDGARALANAPHLTRAAELDLEYNPLEDAGLRPFLDTRYWPALRRLTVPRMNVSLPMRQALDVKFNRPPRRA